MPNETPLITKNYDLEHLSAQEARELFNFFDAQKERHSWKANTVYSMTEEIPFQLSHDILRRKSASKTDEVRYEILGAKIAANVYKVLGTLKLTADTINYKPANAKNNKARVAKKISENTAEELVQKEYRLTSQAGYLAIKEPVKGEKAWYLVMKEIKGESLFHILLRDLRRPFLTRALRIELSIALLKTLNEQVTSRNIIHRDLKPENIIVNLSTNPPTVTIFNFDLSEDKILETSNSSGTLGYAPPEVYDARYRQTEKMDVFSMARVIALIWHIGLKSYKEIKSWRERCHAVNLSSLFDNLPDINSKQKKIIRNTLEHMLKANPEERLSLEHALKNFNMLADKRTSRPLSRFSIFQAAVSDYTPQPQINTYDIK